MKVVRKMLSVCMVVAITSLLTTSAFASEKKCELGNTCEIKGVAGDLVYYSVKPSDGKNFVCYVTAKRGKNDVRNFVGTLYGSQGFRFASHDIRAGDNPVRFDIRNGKFSDKVNGGEIVIQKSKVPFLSTDGTVVCNRAS